MRFAPSALRSFDPVPPLRATSSSPHIATLNPEIGRAELPPNGAYSAMVGGSERKRARGRWGLLEGRTGASPRNPQSLDNQMQFDFKPIQIEKFRRAKFSIISLSNTLLQIALLPENLSRRVLFSIGVYFLKSEFLRYS